MMRLAIAFVALVISGSLAACGGKNKQPQTTDGAGSGSSAPVLAKKAHLSFGIGQGASTADLFLQITDETGRQVSHPLGKYRGTCEKHTPAPEMKAIIGVHCKEGGTGVELHAVVQGNQIIVLKMRADEGVPVDPMAREEVTRVTIALGTAVDAG